SWDDGDTRRERRPGRPATRVGTVTGMSNVRSVVAIVFLVLAGLVPVGADAQDVPAVPPRDPRPITDRPATASGVIRGRVVRTGSGEPVRRVPLAHIEARDSRPRLQTLP